MNPPIQNFKLEAERCRRLIDIIEDPAVRICLTELADVYERRLAKEERSFDPPGGG